MKKKILLAISAVFILMLGIVAFAVNQSNNSSKTAANSCAMKGMNAQTTDGQAKTSCCGMDNCCCKGDSCPMKSSGENVSANCCSCCGDSCPMKGKESASVATQNVTAASGESCCNGGACCKSKKS